MKMISLGGNELYRLLYLINESSKIGEIVGSRHDHCNSLLASIHPHSNLARSQLVQNTIVRVVAQKSQYCYITPFLAGQRWHPGRYRKSILKSLQLLSRYCTSANLCTLFEIFQDIQRLDRSGPLLQ